MESESVGLRVVLSKSVRGQSRKAEEWGEAAWESIGPGPATPHGVWMDLNWEPGNHRGLGLGLKALSQRLISGDG